MDSKNESLDELCQITAQTIRAGYQVSMLAKTMQGHYLTIGDVEITSLETAFLSYDKCTTETGKDDADVAATWFKVRERVKESLGIVGNPVIPWENSAHTSTAGAH